MPLWNAVILFLKFSYPHSNYPPKISKDFLTTQGIYFISVAKNYILKKMRFTEVFFFFHTEKLSTVSKNENFSFGDR